MNIFHWCSCSSGCWWPVSEVPGWGTGAVALPVPSASLPGSSHDQGTIKKQFGHYAPCGILPCHPFCHCGVQYILGGTSQAAGLYLAERSGHVSSRQHWLMLQPLKWCCWCHSVPVMALLPLAPKLPPCRGRVLPFFMTPHQMQEFRRMWWV